ncbi:hypothetical protein IMSAG185_00619 [Lachnospiraceae bacterium]|jgi:DNA-binding transcriptional MerR regulator|nr:DUF1836 domain-containing protein [Lachnospiraceae bacterium]GFI65026.1 hypothetical protein IMSAG185_00619 [Lachnospiraceae bacterium]
MTIDNDNLLNSILESLDRIEYVSPEDIPDIELYMDQVTTLMDSRLRSTARYPGEDKILTKTMINNYAKNDLLPPPVRKKYSKEHVLLLIFIYYYKGILSISDIQTLLKPVTDRFFRCGESFGLEEIYREAFGLERQQIEALKADVAEKFRVAQQTFEDAPEDSRDFLKKFAFICTLSFDVYVKKLMIEKMVDQLTGEQVKQGAQKKSHTSDPA